MSKSQSAWDVGMEECYEEGEKRTIKLFILLIPKTSALLVGASIHLLKIKFIVNYILYSKPLTKKVLGSNPS